jgi:hypothetical protein
MRSDAGLTPLACGGWEDVKNAPERGQIFSTFARECDSGGSGSEFLDCELFLSAEPVV